MVFTSYDSSCIKHLLRTSNDLPYVSLNQLVGASQNKHGLALEFWMCLGNLGCECSQYYYTVHSCLHFGI
jgi:hypothetical protein